MAPSGGHYTTITAALAAINPSAANPYVIEVWPGVYTEPGTVYLKSYVHLKGSGRDVTTVKTSLGTTANVIAVVGQTNVTVSGLNITDGEVGIQIKRAVATISENSFSNNIAFGIWVQQSTGSLVTGNNVIGNINHGIFINDGSAVITDNFISGNGILGNCRELLNCPVL